MTALSQSFVRATNTVGELVVAYVAAVAAGALGFWAAEGLSLGDAMWWALSTSLTFGNAAPETLAGRLVAWTEGVVVVFIITPLLIARLIRFHERDEK